jgi:sigma-B regulation protein RsbU (phosphoserine phosphatase)
VPRAVEPSGSGGLVTERPRTTLVAVAAAVIAFFASRTIEHTYSRLARPEQTALEWISDIVLSLAFGLVAWLWLHLRETRSELLRLERAQIILDTQLALAAEIQQKLLPRVPAPGRGLCLAARMEPAWKIGGDFYDFIVPDAEGVIFILGDISGKGIPAALLMASTRTLFRDLARETRDPGALTTRLSRALYEDNEGSAYATCIMGRFDLRDRTLTYVNAGHPSGLILGPSGRRVLESVGPPVGILPSIMYSPTSVSVGSGDIGVVVTDGVTEALEQDGVVTGDRVLEEAVRNLDLGSKPQADTICTALMSLARRRKGSAADETEQDDRTVVAFVVGDAAA